MISFSFQNKIIWIFLMFLIQKERREKQIEIGFMFFWYFWVLVLKKWYWILNSSYWAERYTFQVQWKAKGIKVKTKYIFFAFFNVGRWIWVGCCVDCLVDVGPTNLDAFVFRLWWASSFTSFLLLKLALSLGQGRSSLLVIVHWVVTGGVYLLILSFKGGTMVW